MDQTLENVARHQQRVRLLYRSERRLFARWVKPGDRVLELGCGDGRLTEALAARGARVVGADLNEATLGEMYGRLDGKAGGVCADARALPFADASFDVVVFGFNGIDFMIDPAERDRVLRNMANVLVPGGVYIVSSHNGRGKILAPRGAWSPRSWPGRLKLLREGSWRDGVYTDQRGQLVMYQESPAPVVRRVKRVTGLRFISATAGRSGVRAPLWLLSFFCKWPYYVFHDGTGRADARSARGGRAKRVVDVTLSALALAVASPVMAIVAALILATLGRPVLFVQRRPGHGGRLFTLYKFRTMRATSNPDGTRRPDAERLTRLGRILRAASLDELPELFNVLRGDMSLVGPRPLLPEYLTRYTPSQARRHDVRPGLTGLAQVRGRNALTWEEKFDLDVFYVENRSMALDLKIIALTVAGWLRPSGISHGDHATMPEFRGSDAPVGHE